MMRSVKSLAETVKSETALDLLQDNKRGKQNAYFQPWLAIRFPDNAGFMKTEAKKQ